MSLKLIQALFIIIAAAGPVALLSLPVRVTYNPKEVTVEYDGCVFSQHYYSQTGLHPAPVVHLYYLDIREDDLLKSDGKRLDDFIRKESWSRPEDEVQAEFLKDQEVGAEQAQELNEWKRLNKHKKKKDPKPTFPERSVDPPITCEVVLRLDNFREVFRNSLRVRFLENSRSQVVIVLHYYSNFDLVSLQTRPDGTITLDLDNVSSVDPGLAESQALEFLHSVHQSPRALDGDSMGYLPSSEWRRPSDQTAFFFLATGSLGHSNRLKTFVEDQVCVVLCYAQNPKFRVRFSPHTAYLSLRMETPNSRFVSNLRLPMPAKSRTLRVTFHANSNPGDLVFQTALDRRGVFNSAKDLSPSLAQKYGAAEDCFPFLRLDQDTVGVEVEVGAALKSTGRMVLKATDAGDKYRMGVYLSRTYIGVTKQTFWVPKTHGKPIRFFWTSAKYDPPKAYQLHFDRKLPIDLAFLKKKHFQEFAKSFRLFGDSTLSTLRPQDARSDRALTDFAWVTNFDSLGEDVREKGTHPLVFHRPDSCDVLFYRRHEGFFVKVEARQVTLLSFTETNHEYSVDHVLALDASPLGPDLKVSAVLFDVDNGMNRFDYSGFAVLPNELYFLTVSTDMQEQLVRMRVHVCQSSPNTLVLCLFSSQRSFEVDVGFGRLTFWDGSRPVEFVVPRFNYAIEPLIFSAGRCVVPRKQRFVAYPSGRAEKYFVDWEDNRYVDIDRTATHCDDALNTCFVIFVQGSLPTPSKEALEAMKVDLKARTCTFENPEDFRVKITKNFVSVYPSKGPGGFLLRFERPLSVLREHRHLFVGENGIRINCIRRDEQLDTDQCDYLYGYFPERGAFLRDTLLRPDAHPLNIPFFFFREEHNFLALEPHYVAGRISVRVTSRHMELSVAGQDISLGSADFIRAKAYQKSAGFASATLKLFLSDLIPVVVPLQLHRFTDFRAALKDQDLDVQAEFPGNVDDFFVYSVFERVGSGEYALYCVENDKKEMEVIVYRASDLGIFEVVDTRVRPETPDLQAVLSGPKRSDESDVQFLIRFDKLEHRDQYFGFDSRTFFHRIPTVFPGTEVLVLRKANLPERKASLSLITYFNDSMDSQKGLGFISSPEDFEGEEAVQEAEDRRRLVI